MNEVKKSIPKFEGVGLAKGKPVYTDDLAPAGSLVVKVLRSPYPFARIAGINTQDAENIPGVECILTYKNVPRNIFTRAGQGYPEPSPYDRYVLDEYVRYAGDEVAVVAAADERTAEEAVKLIKVDYEKLEPVLDFENAEGHSSVIHPEEEAHEMFYIGYNPSKNIAGEYRMNVGNVDEALRSCEFVVSERYYTQAQAHAAMENHTCFSYIDMHDRLILFTSTQVPFHVRRIVARTLGLPVKKIRVVKPRIGGGYGGKQAIHGELLTCLISLRTGKPAKLTYSREDVFEASYTRHAMRIDVTVGSDRDGNIKALDMEALSDTGAYGEHAVTVFMGVGSKTLPLYNKAEDVRFGGKVVYTNHTPAGAYRGYGAVQGNFALESTIDMLAEKLGRDPMELRRQNMIGRGQTSPIFKIMGEGSEGVDMVMESCGLDICVKRGMELIGWKDKYPKYQKSENKVRGIGGAIAMQGSGLPKIDMASGIIRLNDSGFFNLTIGATDIGTGSDTILAQIAAEALGVAVDKIIVYSSDTDLTPFDKGAYASSTTYVSGNAVRIAAENMKKEIEKAASEVFGVPVSEVVFDGEHVKSRDGRNDVSLEELSYELFYNKNQEQLVASGSFCGKVGPPPFAAGFAEVEVDLETGKVEIINFASVVDCGTTINPNLARVQVEGALVQGIGMTMFEDVRYSDSGKLLTNNFINYKIPTRKDVGRIAVEFADSYEPTGPYGAKSVGEIAIDTPPAAIANAVYNATGVRITHLPIKPEDILIGMKRK